MIDSGALQRKKITWRSCQNGFVNRSLSHTCSKTFSVARFINGFFILKKLQTTKAFYMILFLGLCLENSISIMNPTALFMTKSSKLQKCISSSKAALRFASRWSRTACVTSSPSARRWMENRSSVTIMLLMNARASLSIWLSRQLNATQFITNSYMRKYSLSILRSWQSLSKMFNMYIIEWYLSQYLKSEGKRSARWTSSHSTATYNSKISMRIRRRKKCFLKKFKTLTLMNSWPPKSKNQTWISTHLKLTQN